MLGILLFLGISCEELMSDLDVYMRSPQILIHYLLDGQDCLSLTIGAGVTETTSSYVQHVKVDKSYKSRVRYKN